MRRYYVKVRADLKNHSFPNICPFTGEPDPSVELDVGVTTQKALPIPFIGMLHWDEHLAMDVMVHRSFERRQRMLKHVGIILFVFAFVFAVPFAIAMMEGKNSLTGWWFAGAGMGAWLGVALFQAWGRRRMRVKKLGEGFLELGFLSEEYAREFARMHRLEVTPRWALF